MNENKSKKGKSKKILLAVLSALFCLLCVLGIAYSVLGAVNYELSAQRYHEKPAGQNGVFCEIDFDADIMNDKDYIMRDDWYNIEYTRENGAVTELVTDENREDFGEWVNFFFRYFDKLRAGEYRDFDTLFTKSYFDKNEHTDTFFGFTKQRVYDIRVENANYKYTEGRTDYAVFAVTYKIMKNDGTFRNDIAPDQSRTQYFILAKIGDDIFISDILYKFDREFDYSASGVTDKIVIGIVSAVALVVFVAVLITARISRKRKNKKTEKTEGIENDG